MQQTGKATPRPWTYHANYIEVSNEHGDHSLYAPDDRGAVSPETRWANARFAVQAVNAHDELVEALRDIVSFLDEYGREGYCLVCCPPEPGEHIEGDCELLTARAALAKAEGA